MKVLFLIFSLLIYLPGTKDAKTTLSKEEQQELVAAHNKYRADVGVAPLQWSDKLAAEAQQWAEHLAKKGCRMVHSKTEEGENLYWSDYASTPKEVVDEWATEIKYYKSPKKISASRVPRYGHYTQMVWHSTKYVGCGRARCKNGEEIWVCRYDPPDNYLGERAY